MTGNEFANLCEGAAKMLEADAEHARVAGDSSIVYVPSGSRCITEALAKIIGVVATATVCSVLLLALSVQVSSAGECKNGTCTLEVPVSAEVKSSPCAVSRPFASAVERSVGVAAKIAAAPVRAVARTVEAIRNRERKPVVRSASAAWRAAGKVICHRRCCD